ncbi:MAG: GGDEF domain-containing protein [Xanthobacteraceae bacterium]|nr:GGDEF domain-containing protein [Xanthobacteraceae bacterium]
MSQQGPVIVVPDDESAPFAKMAGDTKLFPVIEAGWTDVAQAVTRVQPAAVIVGSAKHYETTFHELAAQVETLAPYTVLIAFDPAGHLPPNAIPFTRINNDPARLAARLNAALRVRTLHATVLRRVHDANLPPVQLPANDPLNDANILLIGRGGLYPALSVALGERMGVIGALSIEAAAKHLGTRDVDGIALGDGFTARVVDAFLTVLSEDFRFRNLPVIVTGEVGPMRDYDLPNLEFSAGTPLDIAINAVPLIRQNAFEARLNRALKSIDAGGLLDPRTGLLTQDAFTQDFTRAVEDSLARGSGLSVARFVFPVIAERARLDAARILSRLMRRMDFATLRDDDSIVVVFAETDLRNARMIARRMASILRQTVIGDKKDVKLDPDVALATLLPNDSAQTIIERLHASDQRAAS